MCVCVCVQEGLIFHVKESVAVWLKYIEKLEVQAHTDKAVISAAWK